mmetsp:Transcript_19062/g.59948  ORF Transcript_19062/g.59948 Transcript_19062/m.59948 type:complete len:302 (+) Transcript_19062:55-960(+)
MCTRPWNHARAETRPPSAAARSSQPCTAGHGTPWRLPRGLPAAAGPQRRPGRSAAGCTRGAMRSATTSHGSHRPPSRRATPPGSDAATHPLGGSSCPGPAPASARADEQGPAQVGEVARSLDVLRVLGCGRLPLLGPHALKDEVLDASLGIQVGDRSHDLLLRPLILTLVLEVKVLCEVALPHRPLLDDLAGDLAAQLHDLPEVVVVCLALEQRPACEELIERAPQRPSVHLLRVLAAKDHLRRPVEATGQVGRAAHVLQLYGRAEVAKLHDLVALADQYVVRLDVRVDDLVLVHVGQTNQ